MICRQVTGGSGSTPNEFDFAGQQSDGSTGLQYLRARYYDPATGVFISRDPLAAGPAWLGNPHGYVDGNPTNLVDPAGLCSFLDCLGDAWSATSNTVAGIAEGIWNGANWLSDQVEDATKYLTGAALRAAQEILSSLKLLGEYAGKIALSCVMNPIDCYVAFEHLILGAALVSLGAGIIAVGCAAGAVLCPIAVVAGSIVMVAGGAVFAVGVMELSHLGTTGSHTNRRPQTSDGGLH